MFFSKTLKVSIYDDDSDNDDEGNEMRTVSNKEWKQLIDDVRDIFNNDLSHLAAITEPSQRVTNKERKRQEQMSTEEGRIYLEKLTSVTRSYLHLVIQCFLKCRCEMDNSQINIKNKKKYRHVLSNASLCCFVNKLIFVVCESFKVTNANECSSFIDAIFFV